MPITIWLCRVPRPAAPLNNQVRSEGVISTNLMAYIPPHKRHSLEKDKPLPVKESFIPLFKRNLRLNDNKGGQKIIYDDRATNKWFVVGLCEDGQFPSHVHLQPVSSVYYGRQPTEKPLTLVNSLANEENNQLSENCFSCPWEIIAENVKPDLLSSLELLRKEMGVHGMGKLKPTLVARFCKIRFHGSSPVKLETVPRNPVDETVIRQLKRSIYTNLPSSYMKSVLDEVVPRIGVDFEAEKDIYHVKLSDNRRPDSTISCKCSVMEDKKLMFYKVELNQVRQMVADISCLEKNLDLRLMLCYKRILTTLTVDEMNCIKDLVSSAVLDSDVKGGLRWPLGKTSSGDRYSVVGVWHTVCRAYSSPSVRLKVRHADRYDFRTGLGEASREVYLKLKGLVSEFLEQGAESDSVSNMLKENLKLTWENFLCCELFDT